MKLFVGKNVVTKVVAANNGGNENLLLSDVCASLVSLLSQGIVGVYSNDTVSKSHLLNPLPTQAAGLLLYVA